MKSPITFLVITFFVVLAAGASGAELNDHSEKKLPIAELNDHPEKKLSIGFEISGLRGREMTQKGGVKPEYNRFRMASDRYFAVAEYRAVKWLTLLVKLGTADLQTHSSEGEVVEFDSKFAWQIGAKAVLYEDTVRNFRINAGLSYLAFDPSDDKVTRIPKVGLSTGGDLSIDWKEFELKADIEKEFTNFTGFAGIRFSNISADQDRVLSDRTVSSSFDADDSLGLYTGIFLDLGQDVNLLLQANFIDERKFTVAIFYSF